MTPAEREQMILDNLPLVRRIARRFAPSSNPALDFDDLVAEGTVGLIQAVDRWDRRADVCFATFAGWRIRGEMLDAMRRLDYVQRRSRAKGYDAPPPLSLNTIVSVPEASPVSLEDTIEDPASVQDLVRIEAHHDLAAALRMLPEWLRKLLAFHFAANMEWMEVADRLELPRHTIYYYRRRALARLRAVLEGAA